jgi:hypothetical protein
MEKDELKDMVINTINQSEGLTRNNIIQLVISDIEKLDIIDFIAEIEADKNITTLEYKTPHSKKQKLYLPLFTTFNFNYGEKNDHYLNYLKVDNLSVDTVEIKLKQSEVDLKRFILILRKLLEDKNKITVKDVQQAFTGLGRGAMREILMKLTGYGLLSLNPDKKKVFEFYKTDKLYDIDVDDFVRFHRL